MKTEMFTVQIAKDGRADLSIARNTYFDLIDEINSVLGERSYSSSELYQIMIYRGRLKPTYFREFEKLIRWGVRQGLIDSGKLVSKTVKSQKLPNFFVKEQWIKFFKNCEDPRTATTCFIAFWCGLRPSEVMRLRMMDLDFEGERIKIIQSKRSKDRIVPFLKAGHSVVKRWIEYAGVKDYLFHSDVSLSAATENFPHISHKTMSNGFREVLERAGMKEEDDRYKGAKRARGKYTFYVWRHSFATYWINKGISPAFVKEAMGHVKMDTTINVYSHISNDKIIESMSSARPKEEIAKPQSSCAKSLIAERFVRGELSKEEAMAMKDDLVEIMG